MICSSRITPLHDAHWALLPDFLPSYFQLPVTSVRTGFFCIRRPGAMCTLAQHTLGSHAMHPARGPYDHTKHAKRPSSPLPRGEKVECCIVKHFGQSRNGFQLWLRLLKAARGIPQSVFSALAYTRLGDWESRAPLASPSPRAPPPQRGKRENH